MGTLFVGAEIEQESANPRRVLSDPCTTKASTDY
jgi:hypothetical protein